MRAIPIESLDLREQVKALIDEAPEKDVEEVRRSLLNMEKNRLWEEIQKEAVAEEREGKWDRLPEVIAEYRARRKQS